ncbi:MAG: response regulator transcription factor [Myxococcales bacterium]|nr:response regulator transcription factor [Myxococcales bacterium]
MSASIGVVLADDHAVLREGLAALIDAQPDMTVLAQLDDGAAALTSCRELSPDVLIVDLTMPGVGGLEVVEKLAQQAPRTRALVLTMHDNPRYLRSALAAGAAGYVVKALAAREVLDAIRAVHRGEAFVRVSLAGGALGGAVATATAPRLRGVPKATLSQRERQVLRLIAYGYTNLEAAEALGVGKKSIDSYRERLQHKLGLSRRSELVRYALDAGLLSAEHDADDDAGEG